MIRIENVTKVYQTKEKEVIGVDDVSMTIQEGEIFGIVGYSGAGKSSLLRCLNLLERPTSGQIFIDNVNLMELGAAKLRMARLKIGMIFQHFHLINQKTVGENLAFALKAARTPQSEIPRRIEELLDKVDLTDKKDVYPNQLSGGQKQRVGIARALANNPSVLLCDEATSALDPTTTTSILQLLKKINEELKITIVLITHEMDVVKEICDRMAIMQDGKVVEMGTVYDMFSAPQTSLTKEFIGSVVSVDVPNEILEKCRGRIVKITFKGSVAGEGIISDMIQQFDVKGNFLHGLIEYIQEKPLGIFLMELTGRDEEVSKALAYMTSQEVEVEVIRDER